MRKILLVEDNETIILGLKYSLEQEGFEVEVTKNVTETKKKLEDSFDLYLLDISLPDGNGFDICKEIKSKKDVPVIFLTARDEETNVVLGLDIGADDYIIKPFRIRELISRINSVLRRYDKNIANSRIEYQDLVIDTKKAKVYQKNEEIIFTSLEYKILLMLFTNQNKLITSYVFGFTDIYYYENKGYNIVVSSDESEDEKILEQYNKIKNMEGIEQSSIQKMGYLSIGKQYINEEVGNYYGSGTKDNEIILPIIAIENIHFEELTKKLGITKEQVGGILADNTYYYKNGKYAQNNQFKIKEGETIQGYIETPHQLGNKENNENDKTSTEIKIIKRLGEEETIGIGKYTNGIIVSEEYLEKNIKQYAVSNLYIKAENPDEFSKSLDNIEDINYTNYNESIKENRAMITVINIFIYGFITVITLIGVTNIFNTITTNMMLRSKEFAMLKSIGMTRKEFNSMIRLESIFYGLKSLIIGLPIGLGLSYLLYKSFNVSMEMQYSIPWIPIGISVLFVFIIVFITMKYSLNKINKQNIIETIRNDNI